MKKIILLNLFALCVAVLFAQKNTYIGLEIPIEHTEYNSFFNQANVYSHGGNIPKFGLQVRQDLSDMVAIETGLIYTSYNRNIYTFSFSPESNIIDQYSTLVSISTSPYNTTVEQIYLEGPNLYKWEIPFRLNTRIHLYKKVYLASQLGCILNISPQNINKNTITTAYYIDDTNINIMDTTEYEINHTSKKSEGLTLSLEAGLALEYHTKNGAFFKSFFTFVKGFNTQSYDYIQLTPKNESTQATAIKSMGSYYSFGISYYYPISNLWKKKPEKSN